MSHGGDGTPTWEWPDMRGRRLETGQVVRLDPGYDEHPDNVGVRRKGSVSGIGSGDWDGFVHVDFVGGKPTWVPTRCVEVIMERKVAIAVVLANRPVTDALRDAMIALGVDESELES